MMKSLTIFQFWLITSLFVSVQAAPALRRASVISLDAAGVLLVDGQKVFPITLTITPPPDAKTPNGKPAWREFRDGGAMFMRTGGPKWDDATLRKELEYQNAAAKQGMRCSPWLGWDLSNIKPGDTEKEEQLRSVVRRLKDSPGMGLWKGADEPEWGKVPPGHVANSGRIIRETDPNHPIWLVQAPRGTVESLKRYDEGWDIGGIDIYPVSYPPGRHTIGTNKELSMVGDFSRMMRETAGPKPFWMTLQIAFSGNVPPKGIIRFPTFFEERFMVYQAVINGSRGLTFFGGGLAPTLNERDQKLGWNWTFWERVLKPLLEEFKPESSSFEALVAPQTNLKVAVTGEGSPGASSYDVSGIEHMVREAGDSIYLFACNAKSCGTEKATFMGLPPNVVGPADVLFETPRKVGVTNGAFCDWFAPYDVHVYRLRK